MATTTSTPPLRPWSLRPFHSEYQGLRNQVGENGSGAASSDGKRAGGAALRSSWTVVGREPSRGCWLWAWRDVHHGSSQGQVLRARTQHFRQATRARPSAGPEVRAPVARPLPLPEHAGQRPGTRVCSRHLEQRVEHVRSVRSCSTNMGACSRTAVASSRSRGPSRRRKRSRASSGPLTPSTAATFTLCRRTSRPGWSTDWCR